MHAPLLLRGAAERCFAAATLARKKIRSAHNVFACVEKIVTGKLDSHFVWGASTRLYALRSGESIAADGKYTTSGPGWFNLRLFLLSSSGCLVLLPCHVQV